VEAVPFYMLQEAESALEGIYVKLLNLTLGDPLLRQHSYMKKVLILYCWKCSTL